MRRAGVVLTLVAACAASTARADDLVVKADNNSLTVRIAGDTIVAGETTYRLPSAVRANLGSATLRALKTSRGKQIAVVSVPSGDKSWYLLLAPTADDPRIVWTGFAGNGPGGDSVAFEKDGAGEKVHVKTSVSLCGQMIPAADQTLDPATLELKPKAMPDPLGDARKTAIAVKGSLVHRPGSASGPRPEQAPFALLRGLSASSGIAAAAADGDPLTFWHPAGSGYEAISFTAPETVAGTGVRISFDAADRSATPPQSLLVFAGEGNPPAAVELPEPTKAGDEVVVTFKEPVHARCIAIVVGPEDPKSKHGRLDLAEVALTTALDGKSLEEIAKGLDGSEAGRARADLLVAAGKPGLQAAVGAYHSLDGGGQESARRVIDAAPCDDKLLFYVPFLATKDRAEAERAHERVEQCGKESVGPLLAKLHEETGEARTVYSEELGLAAPDEAVPVLIQGLAASDAPGDRLVFRRGLVKAAKRQRSVHAFEAALAGDAFAKLSPTTQIDVLRGMGERIGETSGGAAAFEKLWKASSSDFRARYLLLQPAAELASRGAPFARDTLAAAITKDSDARIRAHAADVALGNKDLTAALTQGASDKDARVREASQRSLASAAIGADSQRLLANALGAEVWTFVKRASLAAIANGTDDASVDAVLAKAIDTEEQPIVRSDILTALGARGAKSEREAILARASDDGEALFVRVAALEALGGLCDTRSLPDLTKLAAKGSTAGSESEAKLAMAAIAALGKLHPADLDKRLAGDLQPGVIADVRTSARAAIAEEHVCSGSAAAKAH